MQNHLQLERNLSQGHFVHYTSKIDQCTGRDWKHINLEGLLLEPTHTISHVTVLQTTLIHYNLFVYGLFNGTISSSDYKMSKVQLLVNDELDKVWEEMVIAKFHIPSKQSKKPLDKINCPMVL